MKANLAQLEPAMQKRWDEMGLYAKLREARKGAPKYILHDGPPYANGDLHIGTGLNKVLKDFIVKLPDDARLSTRPTCRAGTATACPSSSKVMQELGRSAQDMPKREIRARLPRLRHAVRGHPARAVQAPRRHAATGTTRT